MSTNNKILVIGAGIAGTTVCYWLRRFGFSPLLIEKFPNIRKGGQGLDLRGVAIEVVKRMGIYERICEMRTQVEIGRYVDTKGNILLEEKGDRFCFRQGDDVEILRGDLVEILMDAIDGVPCQFNQMIDDIKENGDGVDVHFKDGRAEHYDLVIGADGIHSNTRRIVFEKDSYSLVNIGGYFSVFSIPNYLNLSHTEVQCESDQKLMSITSDRNPKIAEAAFMFRSSKVLNNFYDENEQREFLRDTYQDFGWETAKVLTLMPERNEFYFDSVTQVKMKSWTKGRVALVGDAAYCPSPLSGQGNNLAMVGAYILAGELKRADGNYAQAFNRYNELLRPFVEANQRLGVWASEVFLTSDQVSKELAEERSEKIMQEVEIVSNAISLPDYE